MADWQLEDRTPGKTITGPQGPIGPTGPAGPQGPKGDAGANGSKGDQGAQGFTGPQGARGPAGDTGPKGDTGRDGAQGPQGLTGPRGAQGVQGDVGPRGNTGLQGQQGPQGGVGPKGDLGDTGATGPKGDQGIQGVQGPKGDQGIQGAQGVKGDQGAGVSVKGSRPTPADLPATGNTAGDTYIMTTSGTGFNAGDGYSYDGGQFINVGQIRGPQGPQGVAGNTGAQGPKGDTGAQGIQGPKGDKGDTGPQGAQGIQGPKGDKGDTGPQGAQGIQGVKGDTGAQGPKGDTGATGPAPDTSTYARLTGGTFTGAINFIYAYPSVNYKSSGPGNFSGVKWTDYLSNDNGSFYKVIYDIDGSYKSQFVFGFDGSFLTPQLGDLKTYIDKAVRTDVAQNFSRSAMLQARKNVAAGPLFGQNIFNGNTAFTAADANKVHWLNGDGYIHTLPDTSLLASGDGFEFINYGPGTHTFKNSNSSITNFWYAGYFGVDSVRCGPGQYLKISHDNGIFICFRGLAADRGLNPDQAQSFTDAQIAQLSANLRYGLTPPGVIADYAGSSAPAGWLKCNGAAVSRSAYAVLFAAIGTQYGAGDGSTTFNLPDSRGYFRRSLDDGRGLDSGRGLGSTQGSQNQSHNHGNVGPFAQIGYNVYFAAPGDSGSGIGIGNLYGGTAGSGGNENRPVNIAFLAIIKY